MNRLDSNTRAQVIACLVEGCSIRSTVRLTGVSKIRAKNPNAGDIWLWTAIDAATKLVPCWTLGNHEAILKGFSIKPDNELSMARHSAYCASDFLGKVAHYPKPVLRSKRRNPAAVLRSKRWRQRGKLQRPGGFIPVG